MTNTITRINHNFVEIVADNGLVLAKARRCKEGADWYFGYSKGTNFHIVGLIHGHLPENVQRAMVLSILNSIAPHAQ